MNNKPNKLFSGIGQELSKLEKRDWELWVIVSLAGVLVGVGLLAIIVPAAFLREDNVHLEITVSRQLVVGLFVLLVLLNSHLVTRRLELRRAREHVISTTMQHELIRLQSFTDPLTETYNRRSLEDMAGRFISHAQRLKSPLTFLFVDVDHFKQVNTRFGHLTGDFVLVQIAGLLKNSVRGSDCVVRYGGDEFVVIILADTAFVGARNVVERVTASVCEWNSAGHLHGFNLGLTIGIAEWTSGKTFNEILDSADRDLYAKKHARPTEYREAAILRQAESS